MARVRVVLVRPETSANVGACARVVRNTGASGLDLVAPGDWRTVETFHRKAIELGLITQPTCEVTDDTEVLPF